MSNYVLINGEQIPVTPLMDYLKTRDGLVKTLTWFESQRVNRDGCESKNNNK